jgi:iron complex transport system substrate-binding protein
VGAADAGARLVDELVTHVREVAGRCSRRRLVRVFFEEWPEPTISAIRWVSELIEIAGGDDLFRETRARHDARGRFVSVDDVIARDPEVIIASWCGKKVKRESIVERYANTTAVKNDAIYEVPSELILQPGPACLTDGLEALARILDAVAAGVSLPPAAPGEARRGDV